MKYKLCPFTVKPSYKFCSCRNGNTSCPYLLDSISYKDCNTKESKLLGYCSHKKEYIK